MACSKKPKLDNRPFQLSWTTDFGFIKKNNRAICVFCLETVVNRTSSVKRHFETKHGESFKCDADKAEAIKKAACSIEKQTTFFQTAVGSKTKSTEGNRPLSSMSPTIITDGAGGVRLVLGAAGATKIPSASAWVAARYLWMGQDLKEAVDACRTHHSLLPMKLQYERGFPKSVLRSLEDRGHTVDKYRWKSVVEVVSREPSGEIFANSDYRKSGEVAGV